MGLSRFFRRGFWDDERRRELEAHLQHEIDDNLARGMTADTAARAAHLKLGNVSGVREQIYAMNTIPVLESVWQDIRYGVRILRRNPTFACVAILTLALGTGANAAIFQIVDAVRFRSLPVVNPHELVELQIDSRGKGRTGGFRGRRPMFTYALWQGLRDQPAGFASMMAWSPTTFDLAAGGEVRRAEGMWVSGAFFETLGVGAVRGRVIDRRDDTPGCSAPGAVLSHGFWSREYGNDPAAVGRTILLDGNRFEIIGITPERFYGVEVGRSFDVVLPLCSEAIFNASEPFTQSNRTWFLGVMGRLSEGWTAERAEAQLQTVFPGILKDTLPPEYVPEDAQGYLDFRIDVVPAANGISQLRRSYSTPLWILFGATGLVLLVACANLANLMLARATARSREIGLRLAIGASRIRIVRQLLAESFVVAAFGAAAAIFVAHWLTAFLVGFLSTDTSPLFLRFDRDWRLPAFIAAVAALAALLFGLAPALRATTPAAAGLQGARATTDGPERFSLRRILVVVQVALSLVLLVGAFLFGLSLRNLLTLDPGFREEGVLAVGLDLRRTGNAREAKRVVLDTLVERVSSVPGVVHAAEAIIAPMSGNGWNDRIVIDGQLQKDYVNLNAVGPHYFDLLGTPLVAGRDFNAHDTGQSTPVAIVNERFVQIYLGGAKPLGRVFHIERAPGAPEGAGHQIIGVVKDTKYLDLREELPPIAYFPAAQSEDLGDPSIILRASTPLPAVTPAVVQAIRDVNPRISIQLRSMSWFVNRSLLTERLMATLSAFFGGLAVLIAMLGLYGVMSYLVARRRLEIGIRMALGADRGSVVRMVVADATRLLIIGLVAGLALAVGAGKSASALLYGLKPWDPGALALAAVALGATALLASWLPAWRASRVPPTVALRQE